MCYVLIVDHEKESRDILKEHMQQHFVNVHLVPDATSGADALAIAKEHLIEIMILNLDLTDMDGFELMYQLLLRYPNLKTIVTSKTKDFDRAQQALRCGVMDFIIKPIDDTFVFALDRTIKSINHISLYNDESAKRVNETEKPGADIHKMVAYIQTNYHKDIKLADLAAYMHLNEQYTSRLFKEHVGMNFSVYLMHVRLEKAKKLLSTTNMSITDVGTDVGYTEPTYFSKVFKKKAGYTPQQYRKLFKGDRVIIDKNNN